MHRFALACALLLGLISPAWADAPAPGGPRITTPEIVTKLASKVKFDGFEDPQLTLEGALEYLADRYDLSFDINEAAFDAEDLKAVLQTKIAETPLPKMATASLDRLLRKVLSRVKSSGTTYVIRGDIIEITTVQALRKEILRDSDRPLLPLVNVRFDQCPLREALEELARQAGVSVLLDGDAGAAAVITANLINLPLDTAVQMLANMANLRTVQRDNALYLTTELKAGTLREELGQGPTPKAERLPVAPREIEEKSK